MKLKRIRLEPARTPDFPEGSSARGYEFVVPLGGRGYLAFAGWSQAKADCARPDPAS
jgi:hypothetical protein